MNPRRKAIAWNELVTARLLQRIEELEHEGKGAWQAAIADRLAPYVGARWNRQALYDLEKGRRRISVGDLLAFATILDRPLHWFLQPDTPDARIDLGGERTIPPPTAGESAAATTMKHHAAMTIEDLTAALVALEDARNLVVASLDNARTQAAIAQTLDTKNGG